MGNALRPLIIVQLVIAIAALVLGIQLFQKREILKQRTQILERTADEVAKALHHDEFNVATIKDHTTMEGPLRQLVAMGKNRWVELQDTKLDLENTRQDLEQTQLELASTKNELDDARQQVVTLNENLNEREAQLAEANTRISSLETETADLTARVDDLTAQYAEIEEELADSEARYDSLLKDYEELVGREQKGKAVRGLVGKVLLVNPEWNFVVLDLGTEKGLTLSAEMLVHRSDNLVGRVRVSSLNESLSIAEIIPEWKQKSIKKGDFVISPES